MRKVRILKAKLPACSDGGKRCLPMMIGEHFCLFMVMEESYYYFQYGDGGTDADYLWLGIVAI